MGVVSRPQSPGTEPWPKGKGPAHSSLSFTSYRFLVVRSGRLTDSLGRTGRGGD